MIGGAFEIVKASGSIPARMPGADGGGDHGRIIDQYEWLQLTLGRFLAPVRDSKTGIEYLVLGTVDEGQLTRREVEEEVSAFRQAVARIGNHLAEQIACKELVRAQVLVSLQALLELRLPDATDSTAFHLRGGMLQIARWGLVGGVSLADLIAEVNGKRAGGAGQGYFDRLTATLVASHRAQPTSAGTVPSGNGHGDYHPPMPAPTPVAVASDPQAPATVEVQRDLPKPPTNESVRRDMALAFNRDLPGQEATEDSGKPRPPFGEKVKSAISRMPWWHMLYAALGLVLGFLIHAVFFAASAK